LNTKDNITYLNKKKRDKGVERLKKRTVVLGAFVLFGIFYLPSFIYWISSEDIGMGMINTGLMEDSIQLDGWIFRDEYVVKSEIAGKYIPVVGDGERVQALTEVAKILDPSQSDLLMELEGINQELLKDIQSQSLNSGFVFSELQRVHSEIVGGVENMIVALNQSQLFEMTNFKRQIELKINKKFRIIYEGNAYEDDKINRLKGLGERIHQQIEQFSTKIRIPTTGMVSYNIDGYEESFSEERLKEITLEDLMRIDNAPSYVVSEYRKIEKGEPLLKVVRDNSYSILAKVKHDSRSLFQEGSRVNLRIEEINRNIDAEIVSIKRDGGGDYLIKFNIDQALHQMAKFRKVHIKLLRKVHRGLKVPLYAIDFFDKERNYGRIMVLKGGVTRYIDVEIEIYDEDFAIISNTAQNPGGKVKLYDYFILNHHKVKEGKFVN
jgi:putative membrane fusion protein